ncbi:cysteine hydrolase family protein [Arthrobacter sp. B2a2-09]|uniref:cysteine hydrolase family protein n=1 Tax=Arthrobacter sp. B2a2-09 TaxID=2952822 RepID=UPI0022CD26CD|nr:cysteine hydrolase family protein [Arthrobacter sp. B2a2-09]MCZ9881881.1 cysteine hydrolase [Arthrobacter sp. B2a2-09]
MSRVLLVIDIQNDYFPGGAHPLAGSDMAVVAAASVVEVFRRGGEPVVHVQHVWDEPEASFMRPGTPGVEIHQAVRPLPGEAVIIKASPNAFVGTELGAVLKRLEASELVVLGMMTSMCVDSSVRAAAEQGFDVVLVHDACAAPDLEFGGVVVPAEMVHAAFVAALGDGFARVVSSRDIIA